MISLTKPYDSILSDITYLLDTCTISDFVKGEAGVVSIMLSLPPSRIAVSSISVMEIEYGLFLNDQRAKKLSSKIDAFLNTIHLLAFEPQDAVKAAKIRANLKQKGTPIGPYDLLIAGTALNHHLILITSNVGEFSRIPGLKTENWRKNHL